MLSIKRVAWGMLFFLVVCAAFLTGIFWGFQQGYAFSIFHRSASEAYLTLTELQNLSTGNIQWTKNTLELRLDTYIVEHSTGLDNKLFNTLLPGQDSINSLMKKVAQYRSAKPSKMNDKAVKDCIDTVVTRYTTKP